MNKVRVAGLAVVLLGAYAAHKSAQAVPAPVGAQIKIGAHPHYANGFKTCPAMVDSGLDTGTANTLIKVKLPGQPVQNLGSWLMASPNEARSAEYDQRANWAPMTDFVCGASRVGRQVRFTHPGRSNDIDGFYLDGVGGRTHVHFERSGVGLDGEPRVVITDVADIGKLSDLEGSTMASCIVHASWDTKITSGFIDGTGGLLGALLGSGSKENEALSSVCDSLAERIGG